jgi:hypothetical protein
VLRRVPTGESDAIHATDEAWLLHRQHRLPLWRLPEASPDGGLIGLHYIEDAQLAERGKFDFVFTADVMSIRDFDDRRISGRASMRCSSWHLVPLHSDFDRLTVPWFQCGQVGPINQDSDTPRHPRAP